jgi:hypothetical protein
MNTKTIDLANIVLMIISCIAAYLLPFELFLFSYAVLGPLHYLTEISWLHKRDYFATGRRDYLIFIPIAVILTCLLLFGAGSDSGKWSTELIFICFIAAFGMVFLRGRREKLILICGACILGLLLGRYRGFQLIFGMYLPTLIHVFIFTGLFIIYGALKNKSLTGAASVVVFVLCGASFFLYRPVMDWYHVSVQTIQNIQAVKFDFLVYAVMHLLHIDTHTYHSLEQMIFRSVPGQSVMRFIAFAYTYHYLNWFSKTSVIKWHQVPRPWLVMVLVAWVSAVALYAIDYMLGLEVLFLLSMLHVFFEFPLNYRSMVGIADELGLKIPTPAPALATPAAPAAKKAKKAK